MASRGVRIVAAVEAAKGALVLVAGLGLFELLHRDVQAIAERIVEHFHLNPASRTPRILLDAAGALTDERLAVLAMGAIAYSTARFIEAAKRIKAMGVSLLIAESNLATASRIADRLYAIDRGEIIFHGDPGAAMANEEVMRTLRG